MSKKVSDAGKNLLINTIQSVEHQNRRSEENKVWRQYRAEGSQGCVSGHKSRHKSRSEDRDVRRSRKRKRSKSSPSVDRLDSRHCAKHWIKRLYNLKAKDGERWNHEGYKELYPQYFASSSSESSSESEDDEPESSYRDSEKKKKKKKKDKKHKRKKRKKLLF